MKLASTLTTAVEIANKAHANQVDKGGQPYILHPLAVMARVETLEQKIVAVLHDVLEDCDDISAADLHFVGIPNNLIQSILCLTKIENESYEDYLKRVKSDAIATKVKIADLIENSNIDRIKNPTEKDWKRLIKYDKALRFLHS